MRYRESGWAFKLADPAEFVMAFRGTFGSPSPPAPITTPGIILPSTPVLVTATAATAATAAKGPTGQHQATGRPEQPPVADPTRQFETTESAHQHPSPTPTKKSSPMTSSEQTPAELETVGSIGSLKVEPLPRGEPKASQSHDEGSVVHPNADTEAALIDFGCSSDGDNEIASYRGIGDVPGNLGVITPLAHPAEPRQSYSGDLLGLEIQSDSDQTPQYSDQRMHPQNEGGDSLASIVEIHDRFSSFTPVLRSILDPQSVKSFESILTELQLKTKNLSEISEAAPGIEPPTAAFDRLSLHDRVAVTEDRTVTKSFPEFSINPFGPAIAATNPSGVRPRVVLPPAATTTSPESTISPFCPATATIDHQVVRPRVVLPPSAPMVKVAGRVQPKKPPHPVHGASPPGVGANVRVQLSSVLTRTSTPQPVSEKNVCDITATQGASSKLSAGKSRLVEISYAETEKTASRNDEGSISGQSIIDQPAKAYPRTRISILGEMEQPPKPRVQKVVSASLLEGAEDFEEDYPLEAISHTIQPRTMGTTINRVGFYKGQELQFMKENVRLARQRSTLLAGQRSAKAEASSSKPKAVLEGNPFTPRTPPSIATATPTYVATAQTTTSNVPASTAHIRPRKAPTSDPTAQTVPSNWAAAAPFTPSSTSTVARPSPVKSPVQSKSEKSIKASSSISKADKEDKNDKDEEEDYPLEAILKTTSTPSGKSMMNQSGFFKR
jgi:hypothetical protein